MATGKIKFFNQEKRFGFIAGEDGQDYFFHGSKVQQGISPDKGLTVTFDPRKGQRGMEAHNVRTTAKASPASGGPRDHAPRAAASSSSGGDFPYEFLRRKPGKAALEALHHRQEQGRLDIAFDVVWTTETPTALQPCEDPDVPESAIGRKGENTGYNKRWLMIDGQPAISPFTVKGAVANGFANLLGGCYRVPDRKEGHNNSITPGTYPYTGKWKRYRVSMNGKSLPGIIREINMARGDVKIQPVVEYYLDDVSIPGWLEPEMPCQAAWSHPIKRDGKADYNKRIITPGSIEKHTPGTSPANGKTALIYHKPYSFGMDLKLKPGDMGKKHKHRFYSENGNEIDGQVPLLSLAPEKDLLDNVYGGRYCINSQGKKKLKVKHMRYHLGKPWYENLRDLKPGDWCYYTLFNDAQGKPRIAAIGKNFLFKALFNHEETVPDDNKVCTGLERLCPRCALFGVTDKDEGQDKKAVGYAGRFKASTLKAAMKLTETKDGEPGTIPAKDTFRPQAVQFKLWNDGKRVVIRQFALPVMGPPKPSKRDMDGYFEESTGELKGAKRYHHVKMDFDNTLPALIQATDRKRTAAEGMPYAHQMRPVAAVCRDGIAFSGTLGAENCSTLEIAALLALLDKRSAGHAFKLGLGKNIGLGTVSSRIERVWVRQPGAKWNQVKIPNEEKSREELFGALKELLPEAVIEALKKIINDPSDKQRLHDMTHKHPKLKFAKAGPKYWEYAKVETIP